MPFSIEFLYRIIFTVYGVSYSFFTINIIFKVKSFTYEDYLKYVNLEIEISTLQMKVYWYVITWSKHQRVKIYRISSWISFFGYFWRARRMHNEVLKCHGRKSILTIRWKDIKFDCLSPIPSRNLMKAQICLYQENDCKLTF